MKRFSFLAVLFGFCAAAQDHRWSFQTDQNGNIETRLVSGPARPRLARGKLRWFSGATQQPVPDLRDDGRTIPPAAIPILRR